MKIDIRVPVGLPVRETADFIAGCEAAGFSGVGVHDHQHSGRDVFLALALAAERSSRLTLYPATSNPVTRHPMVLASLANSLEEIAPGRVRLTIGPGYLSVGNIGRPRASVNRMREAVLLVRRLLHGEQVELNGVTTRLRNVTNPPPPVLMTAAGPRMMELAGEVADGAFVLVGLHPAAVAAARRRLETGAERAGRDLNGFQTIYITPTTVAEDGRRLAAGRSSGSGPVSHTWNTPAKPTCSGSGSPGSRFPTSRSRSKSAMPKRQQFAMPSACSERRRNVSNACAGPRLSPASGTSSSSQPTPRKAGTTCRGRK